MNARGMARHHEAFNLFWRRLVSLLDEDDLVSGPEGAVGCQRKTVVDDEVSAGLEFFFELKQGRLRRDRDFLFVDPDLDLC